MSHESVQDAPEPSAAMERRVAHVLRLLEGRHRSYQRAAVDEAVELGAAMEPALLAILDKVLAEPEAFIAFGNEDYAGHLYALALVTHFGTRDAHARVVAYARLPEAMGEKLLGDAATELLPAALYRTSGESWRSLRELATDPQVAMGCRDAALGAMTFGALEGRFSRQEVLELFAAFLSEPDRTIADMDFVTAVANRALDLYPAEIMPAVELAFRKGRIDPFAIALADFERAQLEGEEAVLGESRRVVGELLAPEPHHYLTRWAGFEQSEAEREDPARDAKARLRALDKKRKQERRRSRKARKRRR